MSDDDVWSPGDEAPVERAGPVDTAYGEGMWITQAFSLDVAFRLGFALLRERPGLMLGLGAALWFFTNLPTFLSMPGEITMKPVRFWNCLLEARPRYFVLQSKSCAKSWGKKAKTSTTILPHS